MRSLLIATQAALALLLGVAAAPGMVAPEQSGIDHNFGTTGHSPTSNR
jgi:hypothetical protein